MPEQQFIVITQERDMGGYWQTAAGVTPTCRLMLTFRAATVGASKVWEVVSRECPDSPLSVAAFWHIDQGKVRFLNAEGHPLALYGLIEVDRIAPAKAAKDLHPMTRGYIR
jgi:hypothetical protein